MESTLEKLYDQIADIEIAMMTTRRPDGHLESRAMANQKRAAGADLWFVTKEETTKLRDIGGDPHVNLAYYKDRTREWVSVSGIATPSRDRAKIHELYAPDWKMWFGEEGDPRHGTKDDPRMVLIGVDVHAAVFLEMDKPQPVVLFELVKGWLTGAEPDLGEMHRIG
ncbi:MAG TPA: pyridoxamine 5'-phosphate oxidase family protein [Gemmatimonadota bacterium]|nr:pyridoxamine 5'-phosphate oxidase family protein [Gemmatimonadota bacterium]